MRKTRGGTAISGSVEAWRIFGCQRGIRDIIHEMTSPIADHPEICVDGVLLLEGRQSHRRGVPIGTRGRQSTSYCFNRKDTVSTLSGIAWEQGVFSYRGHSG